MKKILIILMLVFSLGCFSQDIQKPIKVYEHPYAYFEIGLGGMIPTDNSNSYFGAQIKIGKFINPIFGLEIEYQGGQESEYYDNLSYFGINTKYQLNPLYSQNKMINFEALIGLGYGQYNYLDDYEYNYRYYYEYRTKFSYIVPKIGIDAYVDINKFIKIGVGPEFAWYISTNRNNSLNVGVVNLFGKVKFNFL